MSTLPSRPGFFSPKSVLLAVLLGIGYWLVVSVDLGDMDVSLDDSSGKTTPINIYTSWYTNRIGTIYSAIDSLNDQRDFERRMELRHMANYFAPITVQSMRRSTDTILLPPKEYLQSFQDADVAWSDPRIFTYMTGISNIVGWNSFNGHNANAFLKLIATRDARRLIIVRADNPRYSIDSLMMEYKAAIRAAKGSQ